MAGARRGKDDRKLNNLAPLILTVDVSREEQVNNSDILFSSRDPSSFENTGTLDFSGAIQFSSD